MDSDVDYKHIDKDITQSTSNALHSTQHKHMESTESGSCGDTRDRDSADNEVMVTEDTVGPVGDHQSSDNPFASLVSEMECLVDRCVHYLRESSAAESALISRLDLLMGSAVEVKAKCGSDARELSRQLKRFVDFVDSFATNE